jgi:hypothetical protein
VSLAKDFRRLSSEMRMAATAAAALAVSLVLPWYQKSYFAKGAVVQANVSALGVFTFVEAAVLLVAFAVLFLVWARSQRKAFHLPGGDGVAITLAGGWALLLLVWRLFDKPDIPGIGVTVGIQWGIFGALLAAGALVVAGARVRAAHAPEPPNPAAEDAEGWVAPPRREGDRRPERRPRDATAVTEMLRDRPTWEERTTRLDEDMTARLPDPADERTERLFEDPSRAKTTRLPEDPSDAPTRRQRRPEDTPPLWDDDPPH